MHTAEHESETQPMRVPARSQSGAQLVRAGAEDDGAEDDGDEDSGAADGAAAASGDGRWATG